MSVPDECGFLGDFQNNMVFCKFWSDIVWRRPHAWTSKWSAFPIFYMVIGEMPEANQGSKNNTKKE